MESSIGGVSNSSGGSVLGDNLDDIANVIKNVPLTSPTDNQNQTPKVTSNTEQYATVIPDANRDKDLSNEIAGVKTAGSLVSAAGGIINANSKYSQITSQNNFNIHMAEIQAEQVQSSSKFNQLREQTKGESRANQSRLSAVAQGQSARGDLANTAASNEDVYAAQNMMNMEINSMRQIFGLQSKVRMMQSENAAAEINRDAEMAHAIIGGVTGVATAYAEAQK